MSLITLLGGSGFIGSALTRRLAEKNLTYVAPDRAQELAGTDLGDVIYCVGLTADFRSQPLATVEAHVCHLLHILKDCEFRSLVYLSSTRVYRNQDGIAREGDPLIVESANSDDLYAISKLMGEAVALASGRHVKVVRISNVYGPDFASENFLSSIIRDAMSKQHLTVHSSPDSERDYISIHDVVDGLLRIVLEGKQTLYNLASGTNFANRQVIEKISEITNCRITFDPAVGKVNSPRISIDRMRSEFEFQPSSVLQDLPQVIEAYKAHAGKTLHPS
ncbi:MAG TPA: SDR family oxidoreductase [Chthoniobacterales bacterium]|nr:SDR family oxidoreductase [Chthoniobacterales bacterium]